MHSTTLCALAVVLTLISVDQCQGTACYECNAATEDDCIEDNSTLLICGSDILYPINQWDVATLTEMLQTLNKKKAYYENKNGYIDIYKKLNTYTEDIQESLDLKLPTPYYVDELEDINDKRNNTVAKYKAILGQWNKEEEAKYEKYWVEVVEPQVDTLKALWKGKYGMPDPPDWRLYQNPDSFLEFVEYKKIIEKWLADANDTVEKGEFNGNFHEDLRHKWVEKVFDHILKREVGLPPKDRTILPVIRTNRATAFPADLPMDETWCALFKSPSLGVQRGCGVKLQGFVFKDGCHNMSAPYENITYCRCDFFFRCYWEGKYEIKDLPRPFNFTYSRPSHSASARRSPCLILLLVITLSVTLMAGEGEPHP